MEEDFKDLLKPCPYCGGEPVWAVPGFLIVCKKCGWEINNDEPYAARAWGWTTFSTVVAWNNLGASENERLYLGCPTCGSCKINLKRSEYGQTCCCQDCDFSVELSDVHDFDLAREFAKSKPARWVRSQASWVNVAIETGHRSQTVNIPYSKRVSATGHALKRIAQFWFDQTCLCFEDIHYDLPIDLYIYNGRSNNRERHIHLDSWPQSVINIREHNLEFYKKYVTKYYNMKRNCKYCYQ